MWHGFCSVCTGQTEYGLTQHHAVRNWCFWPFWSIWPKCSKTAVFGDLSLRGHFWPFWPILAKRSKSRFFGQKRVIFRPVRGARWLFGCFTPRDPVSNLDGGVFLLVLLRFQPMAINILFSIAAYFRTFWTFFGPFWTPKKGPKPWFGRYPN